MFEKDTRLKLLHGDCLNLMATFPANIIDLTITSPPYDMIRKYENTLEWNKDIWQNILKQLYRITVKGGIVVWVVKDATVNGSETCTSFKQAIYAKEECGFNLHDTMIYHKEAPPLTHNRYEQKFEYMFVFSKGRPNTFNGLREKSRYAGESRRSMTLRQDSDELSDRCNKGYVQNTKLRGNVFEYGIGFNKTTMDKVAYEHPAIFPEQLALDHIVTWTNENAVILDPMMGSGTVGKMAMLNNRKFIGIEKVEKYYKISQTRINAAMTNNIIPIYKPKKPPKPSLVKNYKIIPLAL